jgi:hypothetical protein
VSSERSSAVSRAGSPLNTSVTGKDDSPEPTAKLAEFIPLAVELSGRLVSLEHRLQSGLDFAAENKRFEEVAATLADLTRRLQRLKDSTDYECSKLVDLREDVKQELESLTVMAGPLNKSIRRLGNWRREWSADKKRWAHWRTCIVAVGTLLQSDKTFARVQASADRILHIIHEQLESQLAVQEKAGLSQTILYTLTAECNRLLEQERHSDLLDASPPLLSKRFVFQFVSHELWLPLKRQLGLGESDGA